MPKKTKKEYETVEKEIEYTECDVPGCFHTDEEKELIELAVNPRYTVESWQEPTVIEICDDFNEAEEWVHKQNKHMQKQGVSFNGNIGYGYKNQEHVKEAKSDASFFVCQYCLKNHFDAVPDRYNPDKVTEIDSKKGRLVITQEINPTFSIPAWVAIGITIIHALILIAIVIF